MHEKVQDYLSSCWLGHSENKQVMKRFLVSLYDTQEGPRKSEISSQDSRAAILVDKCLNI